MATRDQLYPALSRRPFLGENFLLENEYAEYFYHEHAAYQPIIDYHCHLCPHDIVANRQFHSLTEAWLEGDHYKWRVMRTQGVPERYITGDASDWEKFEQWAKTVPFTARNPIFHWTHLELRRYFGIEVLLNACTAADIYHCANTQLAEPDFSTQGLLRRMRVEVVCTTDDPADDLQAHATFAQQHTFCRLLPSFRPDKAILIQREGFPQYLERLGAAAHLTIRTFDDLLQALERRILYFHEHGCRLSDHGLERLYAADFTDQQANTVLQKRLSNRSLTPQEVDLFQSALLYYLGKAYARQGWVQQFHLGALRNNNSRMMRTLGPDTGFDSIGDFEQATALGRFLDRLDQEDALAKTILYNLNPRDNEVFATMIGNFNDGSVPGKIQWGSAWWFLDQKDGIEKQLNTLSNMGLLARFVGMLTDSRSFLSFPRHEYFRRILCNLLGRDVANGELPADLEWLGSIVADICYRNAKAYFGL